MSWRRTSSPGWAAFDLQQKPKQILQPRIESEPFPSLPTTVSSLHPCNSHAKDNNFSEKSYASAALPSVSFPDSLKDKQADKTSEASNFSRHFGKHSSQSQEKGRDSGFCRLKVLYSWADDSLIEDILSAVDDNFEKASTSLESMVSDLKYEIPDGKTFQTDKFFSAEKPDDLSSTMNFDPSQLTSTPIEPEWEEDDVYLSQRKDAMKIIRAASKHSKAASNSFLRGDHSSAQHFSKTAQEEWEAAEKLNQKAANEILSIRNYGNGMWKLDLHGLHAVEAVQALMERLNMIETQTGSKTEAQHDLPSLTDNEMKPSTQQTWIRQRPVSLEVITGIGNHSRGEAAIPAAIKSFLIDNRYRHEETRPGVIMVRPKFRRC